MELLKSYDTSSGTSQGSDDQKKVEIGTTSSTVSHLSERAVRQVYLITFSQANLKQFPTRRSFAEAVVCAFTATDANKVLQWVCSSEQHKNGGSHYHMAVKLDRCKRRLSAKQ